MQTPPIPHGKPFGSLNVPHIPCRHVFWVHSVFAPGQSVGERHWTQEPAPLHTPIGQAVPVGLFTQAGTPPVHVAVWQTPQDGRFMLSGTDVHVPLTQAAA